MANEPPHHPLFPAGSKHGPFILSNYLRIARPDHWIKNVFVLPGAAAALAVAPGTNFSRHAGWLLCAALLCTCLAASANYTINEYLDAATDRYHPVKSIRPGATGHLDRSLVGVQYLVLAALSLAIASSGSTSLLFTILSLLVMGIIYNVNPLRSKDRAYLDVLSESINNPLRFLVGWFVIAPAVLPPVSALLAYWMGGAFLMAIKRFSEFRRINDPVQAALYRKSFGSYTETSLLLSSFFYALCAAFFIAIFLVKYRIGLVLTFPIFAALFTYYLSIGLRSESAAAAPEKLYKETGLLTLAAITFVVVGLLFVFDLPFLQVLTETRLLPVP